MPLREEGIGRRQSLRLSGMQRDMLMLGRLQELEGLRDAQSVQYWSRELRLKKGSRRSQETYPPLSSNGWFIHHLLIPNDGVVGVAFSLFSRLWWWLKNNHLRCSIHQLFLLDAITIYSYSCEFSRWFYPRLVTDSAYVDFYMHEGAGRG